MSASRASSIYSRSVGSLSPGTTPIHRRTSSNVPSEPDCPYITAPDHQIGDARGFSTALEATASRLQSGKKVGPSSDCGRQKALADELTAIQWENEFYGECSELYEELVLAMTEVSRTLLSQSGLYLLNYHSESDSGPADRDFLLQGARDLELALQKCRAREVAALQKWKDSWTLPPGTRVSMQWI